MVKSILIDEQANQKLTQLLANSQQSSSKTGLIIGTIDQSKDFITSVIATPSNTSEVSSNDSFDYDWIINHALQIHDMLIGGCDILGVYTIDLSPSISKQILVKLFKALNEFDYFKQMKFNTERLVFLVDSSSKK